MQFAEIAHNREDLLTTPNAFFQVDGDKAVKLSETFLDVAIERIRASQRKSPGLPQLVEENFDKITVCNDGSIRKKMLASCLFGSKRLSGTPSAIFLWP